MFLEMITWQSQMSTTLIRKLVDDIPPEKFFQQPTNLPNHPGWQIAHLTFVRATMCNILGSPAPVSMETLQPFAPGSAPSTDPALCRDKAHWLAMFDQVHAHFSSLIPKLTEEQLRQPPPERFRSRFPQVRHVLATMASTHDGWHIGQLTDWRRAMGLAKVM